MVWQKQRKQKEYIEEKQDVQEGNKLWFMISRRKNLNIL